MALQQEEDRWVRRVRKVSGRLKMFSFPTVGPQKSIEFKLHRLIFTVYFSDSLSKTNQGSQLFSANGKQ